MFSKFFSMDRGGLISSLTGKATFVPMTAGMLAVVGMAFASGTASAAVIYQDSFTGSPTLGTLNGTAPTVDHGASADWLATNYWSAGGYFNSYNAAGTSGRDTAQLNFTPTAGNIYDLSATVSLTNGANNAAYLSIGFLSDANSGNLTDGWDQNPPPSGYPSASPWALVTWKDNAGTYFTGPGTANGAGFSTGQTGPLTNDTFNLVLNTTGANTVNSPWTYQFYNDGSLVSGSTPIALPAGTFISAVGMQGASAIGTVSNFELATVPEPATLGLVAIGGLGLLLLKRRKAI